MIYCSMILAFVLLTCKHVGLFFRGHVSLQIANIVSYFIIEFKYNLTLRVSYFAFKCELEMGTLQFV